MTKRQKLGRQISSTTLRLKKGSIEVETSTMTDSSLTTYNIEKLVTGNLNHTVITLRIGNK